MMSFKMNKQDMVIYYTKMYFSIHILIISRRVKENKIAFSDKNT